MPKCEICDVKVEVVFRKNFNDNEYLDICKSCFDEYDDTNYLDDSDHERDIKED